VLASVAPAAVINARSQRRPMPQAWSGWSACSPTNFRARSISTGGHSGALDLGIHVFADEPEGHRADILRDIAAGTAKPQRSQSAY
jgi:hypothetical protein